jgi:hypothetical protein
VTVRRAVTDAAGFAALGGVALVAVLLVQSGHWRLAVDAYLLFLGALALLALTRITRVSTTPDEPPQVEEMLERMSQEPPPEDEPQLPAVARLEREVTLAATSSFDFHVRMRPTLREIAEHKLYDRHGVSLDEQPERARRILGDATWELVRPDRPAPSDRHGPGLPQRELAAVVETLEKV